MITAGLGTSMHIKIWCAGVKILKTADLYSKSLRQLECFSLFVLVLGHSHWGSGATSGFMLRVPQYYLICGAGD